MPLEATPYLLSIDHLLSEDERLTWEATREFCQRRIAPNIEHHYEKATFPRELIPEFGEMGLLGSTLAGYGCMGMNPVAYGLTMIELERQDSGIRSFCSVQSALVMDQVVEPYIRGKAIRYLDDGKVVIFAAGTGNPFFTTDTAAALRGSEIGAEIVLKATKVDGIYTADPKKDASASRYQRLSFDEAISRNLQVMDATAFALCRDQRLPVNVFSIFKPDALKRVICGEDEGTLVYC